MEVLPFHRYILDAMDNYNTAESDVRTGIVTKQSDKQLRDRISVTGRGNILFFPPERRDPFSLLSNGYLGV
jgi:hypothetical protein